jgi:transcriptional regulator with XRE-family HTH domain
MLDKTHPDTQEEHPLLLYRRRHGLTQAALAAKVGSTPATLCRIEIGIRRPALRLLQQLVAATEGEVSADEIIAHAVAVSARGRRR